MRNLVAALVLVVSLALGATAWAGEQTTLYCTHMPECCTITCVMIDLECCGCGSPTGPLLAEFLDGEGNVLGTATFTGDWCCEESIATLDKPVDANLVCSVRLVKPDDDAVIVTWAKLKVYCGDECWGKWYKVFKGDLCWEAIPVVPEPAPAPPAPPVVVPPVEKPKPEPKPEPKYEMPAEEPEAEPEVIQVPGRG